MLFIAILKNLHFWMTFSGFFFFIETELFPLSQLVNQAVS